MGGNLVIVTSVGCTRFVDVGSGATIGTKEATLGDGIVLRKR